MDPLLLCTDDGTRSPPALTDSLTEDLDPLSLLQSPTVNMPSEYETGAEAALSDPKNNSTDPLSNVSKCPSQERSTDCLEPSSSSYNMSECLSLCSEPAPKDDDFRVCSYFGSSEPVLPLLPHFSHDLISPLSESFSEFHVKEPALSLSLVQGNSTSQPTSTSEGSMEPSVTEPLSGSEHSRATNLLSSLWHQSDSLESDTAIAPVSDLYIYEGETQDFILSHDVDPQEIQCPEYQPLSQTGGKNPDM